MKTFLASLVLLTTLAAPCSARPGKSALPYPQALDKFRCAITQQHPSRDAGPTWFVDPMRADQTRLIVTLSDRERTTREYISVASVLYRKFAALRMNYFAAPVARACSVLVVHDGFQEVAISDQRGSRWIDSGGTQH